MTTELVFMPMSGGVTADRRLQNGHWLFVVAWSASFSFLRWAFAFFVCLFPLLDAVFFLF